MADSSVQDDPPFGSTGSPTLQQLVDYLADALTDPGRLKKIETTMSNAGTKVSAVAEGVTTATLKPIVKTVAVPLAHVIAETLLTVLSGAEPLSSDLSKLALDSVLGAGIARAGVPGDVGNTIIQKLSPPAGTVEPSLAPAAGYMTTMVSLEMETWLMGLLAELFGDALDMARGAGITLQSIAELRQVMTSVFGGGRLTRRVLAPIIDDSIVAPAKRYTMQTYRPTLLSEASAVRQFLRGRWTEDRMRAELAQLGWSDERIDAHLNEQRKFLGAGDVRTLVDRGEWPSTQGLQHLRDQGYDQDTATAALRVEGLRIIAATEAAEAEAIISAFASGAIDGAGLADLLQTAVSNDAMRAFYAERAAVRRQVHVKHLTAAQVAACVKAKILAYPDYVDALTREGYDDTAIAALELLLRSEVDSKTAIDQHRADAAKAAAAAKAARDAKAAAKLQEVEAARALKAQGSFADLSRAFVRGLIPITRLEQILTPQYDADTVAILLQTVQAQRQDYVDKQAKAADAAKRAAHKNLNTAQLDNLYYDGQLTLADLTARLTAAGLAADDVQLLTTLARDTKQDRDAAKAKRAAAAAKAQSKGVNLSTLERLVLLGARPMSDYDSELRDLGYDDSARADMEDLLTLSIAKAKAADAAKAAAAAKLKNKPLTEAEVRRSVLLGTKTVDQYQAFLVQNDFDADAIATLVADLQAALTDATAARARRAAAAARQSEPALPLSTYVRAASLGLITPAVYQAHLAALGYSSDDVAIDLELLQTEIAAANARHAKADAIAEASGARALSLHQEEVAVLAGAATMDDYAARAASLNYAAADIDTLVAVLQDKVDAKAAAAAAKAAKAPAGSPAAASLAAIEAAVQAGTQTLADYQAALEALGFAPDDVTLLVGELSSELASTTPPGA